MPQTIILLDFGSQYTQVIARRIREANVYCELQSCLVDVKYLKQFGSRLKGIIFSGGPSSVTSKNFQSVPKKSKTAPILAAIAAIGSGRIFCFF